MSSTSESPQKSLPLRSAWAIVAAAGQSSRLGQAGLPTKKQFLIWQDVPLFWHSVRVFARVPAMRGVVVVFPEAELEAGKQWVQRLMAEDDPGVPVLAVQGGALRQDSVRLGLAVIPRECGAVLVHDAARPFLSPTLVQAMLEALREHAAAGTAGVVPGIPVTDTIKEVADGQVMGTPDRGSLVAVQTPQAFVRSILEQAHQHCVREQWAVTDDASLLERLGFIVRIAPGDPCNTKITNPDDLKFLKDSSAMNVPVPCVGFGYDVHRFGPGRPMKLGGISFPGGPEIIAHSDGDVLLHALADALLGCLGRGDIGDLFPDTDPRFEGIDSAILLSEVLELVHQGGLTLTHVDVNIITQIPKIAPRREEIRRNLARLLQLDPSQVGVKAGTEEGMGFTGAKQGIKAMAVVTALKSPVNCPVDPCQRY
ncbi:2-C-methyl-D-erythritol 4-phosphate cytidylyltransferase [Desulfonatronum thiosulfatophilum]|nr:2-C-methyl-D-erythritol 4-phosphate cytidylyltransferase [Desulfonatronum thiosulfatophilum]